ncbi:hypothetical protein D9X91_03320 [Falsibacillus albus]|uniref:DUF3955 domain-containing protein n=2 Tax=Falsibacillus albus TaxID=2478915 RepID=A0A3L7K3Y3_9BACI|nr:hypothetical protein D9X91_03320 [Falsibacillus albus]
MFFRMFFLLTGFGLAVTGGVSLIAYLNMLAAGESISGYFRFVSTRIEFFLLIIGILLITMTVYIPKKKK